MRPITKPSYNPAAASVELFEGIDQGSLAVTVIPNDAFGGNVFVENRTDKPLTVRLPKAVAAVQVLKQGFGAPGAFSAAAGPGAGVGGRAQTLGGTMGTPFGFNPGLTAASVPNGVGNVPGILGPAANNFGFFSIPPEKVVQVPLTSVCLEHGKPDPMSAMRYKLIPVESYTSNPVLSELLTRVGSDNFDRAAVQAAAWHLAGSMSWETLASKTHEQVFGTPGGRYFTAAQLAAAQDLVSQASGNARERSDKSDKQVDAHAPRNRRPETQR